MPKSQKSFIGAVLIGFAAFLWATDALVRVPAGEKIDPAYLVFLEHILVILVLLPYVIFRFGKKTLELSSREFLCAAFSGIGGSALATTFFTASMNFLNPSVCVLLQKIQPIFVVGIAYFFLKERPTFRFFIWGPVALAAGVVLSFPDFNFDFLNGVSLESVGIRYAIIAAFLWAASTVSGKFLVKQTPPVLATFWRFIFGFLALSCIMAFPDLFLRGDTQPTERLGLSALLQGYLPYLIVYLSLVPGLLAFILYYAGLSRTQASVAAFTELIYPVGAVILNTVFLKTPLDPVQLLAGSVLLLAVTLISWTPRNQS